MKNIDRSRVLSKLETMSRFTLDINNCPFCQSANVGLCGTGAAPHMTCLECGADGPMAEIIGDGRDAACWRAISKWNKRA